MAESILIASTNYVPCPWQVSLADSWKAFALLLLLVGQLLLRLRPLFLADAAAVVQTVCDVLSSNLLLNVRRSLSFKRLSTCGG